MPLTKKLKAEVANIDRGTIVSIIEKIVNAIGLDMSDMCSQLMGAKPRTTENDRSHNTFYYICTALGICFINACKSKMQKMSEMRHYYDSYILS